MYRNLSYYRQARKENSAPSIWGLRSPHGGLLWAQGKKELSLHPAGHLKGCVFHISWPLTQVEERFVVIISICLV